MQATANIEAINGEQIATVTDLLLVRARNARARLSSNRIAFANDARVHLRTARASQPDLVVQTASEPTLLIRVRRAGSTTTFPAVLATLFAIAIVLTSIL